jgi:hypothetical protein
MQASRTSYGVIFVKAAPRGPIQFFRAPASSEAADPFCTTASKPWFSPGHRHLEPSSPSQGADSSRGASLSSRMRAPWPSGLKLAPCGTKDDALGQHAIAYEVPQGDEQLACQCGDHLLTRTAGRAETASFPAAPEHCRSGRVPSPGSCFHSRRASPGGPHSGPRRAGRASSATRSP